MAIVAPRYRIHYMEASPEPLGTTYGWSFNAERPCVVSDEIGRDRHGSCTRNKPVLLVHNPQLGGLFPEVGYGGGFSGPYRGRMPLLCPNYKKM